MPLTWSSVRESPMGSERIHAFPDTVRPRRPGDGEDGEAPEQEEEAESPSPALVSGLRWL
jgi:hypothetical protein